MAKSESRTSQSPSSKGQKPQLNQPGVSKVKPGGSYQSGQWIPPDDEELPTWEAQPGDPDFVPTGYFRLGLVRGAHGIQGEVEVHLETDDATPYRKLTKLYVLSAAGRPVPREVKRWHLTEAHRALALLEGIADRDAASGMLGQGLFLPLSQLPKLTGTQFYFHEVIGFKLCDVTRGGKAIGTIHKVLEAPAQPLLEVHTPQGQVLVPIVREWVKHVDREARELHMELPEGLVEVYTQPEAE